MLRIDTEKGEVSAAGLEKEIIAELACAIRAVYNAIDDDAKPGFRRVMTALIEDQQSPVWEKMNLSEGDVFTSICIPAKRDK